MNVGILSHHFLSETGANDFLINILRGLSSQQDIQVYFIVPPKAQKIRKFLISILKKMQSYIPLPGRLYRKLLYELGDGLYSFEAKKGNNYSQYFSAHPRIKLIRGQMSNKELLELKKRFKIDIFFPTMFPWINQVPSISYWYDCQHKYFPEYFDNHSINARDDQITGLLKSGNLIIVNSLDVKNDLAKFYGADSDRIINLPFSPMIDEEFFFFDSPNKQTKPYFIVSNQFWIHKNLEVVLHASRILLLEGFDFDVLFTGKLEEPRVTGYVDALNKLRLDLRLERNTFFLGLIPKFDQLGLMKNSLAIIQPTLFEGGPGGGSVFEGIALGKRCIITDLPINKEIQDFPEVTYFKATDANELAEAMRNCLNTNYNSINSEELRKRMESTKSKLGLTLKNAFIESVSK